MSPLRQQMHDAMLVLAQSGGMSLTKTGPRVKREHVREHCSIHSYGHRALRVRERGRREI